MEQIIVIIPLVFVAGATLLLERRCLGKTAFVQPMVLCLVAGIILDAEEIGIWFGVSLQLLSIGQAHYCNWALASTICAGSLITLDIYDMRIAPGSPVSLVMLCASILFSILVESYEKKLQRLGKRAEDELNLWKSAESFSSFGKIIHRRVAKGFLLGGLQSLLGVSLATLLAFGADGRIPVHPLLPQVVTIAVPIFGVAVTLGSLSGRRYPFLAAIGLAVFLLGTFVI